MPAWSVFLIAFSLMGALPRLTAADDTAIGRTLGEAGRAVVDEARNAYETSRDAASQAGRRLADDARAAYEEARDIGPRMAEDFKEGFQGAGQTPNPADEIEPVRETP